MLEVEMKNRLAKYLSPDKDKPLHFFFCATDDHELQMRTAQDRLDYLEAKAYFEDGLDPQDEEELDTLIGRIN